jgi:hypothetical protein
MRRKIKIGVQRVKQSIQKARTYFGYEYLIVYVWIGFAVFTLIQNDASIILWAIVPIVLSMFLYSKINKSRKTLAGLKNTEIQPDFEALSTYSNQLKKSCHDFLCKLKVVILVLDFEKETKTKTENQIALICIASYVFGLVILARNLPATNEVYRGLVIFSTTFGIMVFMGLFWLYFKVIKKVSEFLVLHHISDFARKNRTHVRNILAMISTYKKPNLDDNERIRKVLADLSSFEKDLTEVEDSLKGQKRSITISLASLFAYVASLATFLYNIYPQLQTGSLQMLSIYGGMIILAIFGSVFVFLLTPLSRMRNMLAGLKIIENEERIAEDIRSMMSLSLGKELSEVASESLHVAD